LESGLPIKDKHVVLVNIMEELVKIQVRETIRELGACECRTCFLNACALALNTLQPRYATSEKGALLSKFDETKNAGSVIVVAVTKAVMKVKECPHH